MHLDSPPLTPPDTQAGPWYRGLTRYQWFVFFVCALGWMFDCLDQQLFLLARTPAIQALLHTFPADPAVHKFDGYVTMIFMMGWALGGLGFGILGDRLGRAKTMMLTILVYSMFTGLSALSVTVWDFALYRFLTGMGVGGEFAVGVSLVAEVMPDRSRPSALGWLQALSAVGNITAALVNMLLGFLQQRGVIGSAWQLMFVVGALPALLTVLVMRRLKEPEAWKKAAAHRPAALAPTSPITPLDADNPEAPGPEQKLGSLAELFGTPRLRRNTIVGMLLAFSGVVGLWGIGFFSFELIRSALRKPLESEARDQGAEQKDLAFVQVAILSKGNLDEAAKQVRPSDLLNPDARFLYRTALLLRKKDRPISPDSLRAALDDPTIMKEVLKEEGDTGADLSQRLSALRAEITAAAGPEKLGPDDPRLTAVVERSKGIEGDLTFWVGIESMILNLGAFFGIYAFSRMTHYLGRKPAFAISFVMALLSTAFTFWFLKDFVDVFWMVPLMGFWQLSLFGGYAIYFPELFPTRLRSTGTSFCYNVGRFVAAVGPLTLGLLASEVFSGPNRLRLAGVTMCSFFLIGLLALPFAPETKGQPLPE